MKQQNQTRALFDAVTDVDAEWIEEAAEPRTLHWSRPVLRIAAIAAVLALLLTALLWPGNDQNVSPYFSVYVYASENECEELILYSSSFSNWDPKKDPDYRPELDSDPGIVGEENSTDSTLKHLPLCIEVRLDDELQNATDRMGYFVDGEKLNRNHTIGVGFLVNTVGEEKGYMRPAITGYVEKPTTLDIYLYAENGDVLQHYSLIITPVSEGYKIELAKAYITRDGKDIILVR